MHLFLHMCRVHAFTINVEIYRTELTEYSPTPPSVYAGAIQISRPALVHDWRWLLSSLLDSCMAPGNLERQTTKYDILCSTSTLYESSSLVQEYVSYGARVSCVLCVAISSLGSISGGLGHHGLDLVKY